MSRIATTLWTALAALMVWTAPALAQNECRSRSAPAAQELTLGADAPPSTLAVMLSIATNAGELAVESQSVKCRRGAPFSIGGSTFQLSGENNDTLPRVAVGTDPGDPVVFARRLPPQVGQIVQELTGDRQTSRNGHILVLQAADRIIVLKVYRALPSDDQIRSDMATLGTGYQPAMAFARAGGGATVFMPGTGAGGAQAPTALSTADGTVFTDAGANAVRHQVTGFVCPQEISGVARRGMTIFDPSDGGRDVSCGYGVQGSSVWHSVFLTRIDGANPNDAFRAALEGAQTGAPKAADIPPPLPAGPAPLPGNVAFWRDLAGANQGVIMSSFGDWHTKIRTTYVDGHDEDVARFIRETFAMLHQTFASQLAAAP